MGLSKLQSWILVQESGRCGAKTGTSSAHIVAYMACWKLSKLQVDRVVVVGEVWTASVHIRADGNFSVTTQYSLTAPGCQELLEGRTC